MALITVPALLIGLATKAVAANGGGTGEDGGGGVAPGQMAVTWKVKEAWDSSRAGVEAALKEMGFPSDGTDKSNAVIDNSIKAANAECQNSYTGEGNAECRLVGVGIATWNGKWYAANHLDSKTHWMQAWKAEVNGKTYNHHGATWHTGTQWADNSGARTVDMLAEETVDSKLDASLRVIVLAKDKPVPASYDLTITTNQQAGSNVQVGSDVPVRDAIHASNNGSAILERVDATVRLRFDGGPYAQAGEVSKKVSIANNGDTSSPEFTPADLGWQVWQEGTYWFDVQVARQGKMKQAVDTPDRDPDETFVLRAIPPPAPSKTITAGTSASQMSNTTTIVSGTGRGGYEMTFTDAITPNGVSYAVANMKVVDRTNGDDVSDEFVFAWDKQKNVVSASRPAGKGMMPSNHQYAFTFDVIVSKPGFSTVRDEGKVTWNRQPEQSAGTKEFPTWKPTPDKSWIAYDETAKRWKAVIDPGRSNATGADGATLLDGDKVASVVNTPVAADLVADQLKTFVIEDDFARAAYMFAADGVSAVRVYEAEASNGRQSSVADIVAMGRDVTAQYDIRLDGTKVTATAKAAHLKKLTGLDKPMQVTLLVPGRAHYAYGQGAAQVRKDLGKAEGEEVAFCAVNGRELTNAASVTVNDHTEATNEPKICGYLPPVRKDVLSEGSQGGEQESVQGKVVFPGQRVEYVLDTQPNLPADLAYGIERVSFMDSYDPYLQPDKQTVELTDLTTGRPVSKKKYATEWDEANHRFTLTVTDATLLAQWKAAGKPRVQVRFEGTVSEDAPTDRTINNQWMLVLNNSLTPSNEVFNIPPELDPRKENMSGRDSTVSIDGRTLLLGETGHYVVTLDAKRVTQENAAYKVQRLGIVDDFDDEYVSIDASKVEVLAADGRDVTGRFNIQLRDGMLYVFAKTVDTEIPATGVTVKGDPQPTDLKEYATRALDPLNEPSIDQNLLGQEYRVVMPYTVIKVTDGYTVRNKATQVTNDRREVTNEVSNPLKPLNPAKDVTVKVNGDSKDGQTIYLNRLFLYRLDSSILPANRAYPEVTEWRIGDRLEPEYDEYTGQWAVYATRDLYKDGKLLAKKGERIAGSGFGTSKLGTLFTLTADESGLITVEATEAYRRLVSADVEHEAGWSAYVQAKRVKATDRHENRFTETVNGKDTPSNVVWTRTPELTPSLSIEKWDTASGWPNGDRDNKEDALTVNGDTDITFTITNTSKTDEAGVGAIYRAKDLKLEDSTIVGDAHVTDLKYPKDWDTLLLKPGDSVNVTGTLKNVSGEHTDRAKVSGTPLMECPVDDETPFDGSDADADKDGTPVTIDGTRYCTQPAVESATDDWNGTTVPLAQTGSAAVGVAVVAIALAGLAFLLRTGPCCRAGVRSARHARH